MVQLPDEEKTICVVYDTTPSSTQKRMNLVVRSTYDIRKLFETVKTQYHYEHFQLVMQASDEEEINKVVSVLFFLLFTLFYCFDLLFPCKFRNNLLFSMFTVQSIDSVLYIILYVMVERYLRILIFS